MFGGKPNDECVADRQLSLAIKMGNNLLAHFYIQL